MRLLWMHVWRSWRYQSASAEERRLIEIRYALARKLQSTRRRQQITQQQLAQRLRVGQASISRVERASNRVSLDIAVRALISLGCPDAEIAATSTWRRTATSSACDVALRRRWRVRRGRLRRHRRRASIGSCAKVVSGCRG